MYGNTNVATSVRGGTMASGGAVPTPAIPLLDDARQSLESALKDLYSIIEQVRAFNDGVLGSQPAATGPAGNANEPVGRAETVRQHLGWLHASLDTLRGEVNRLGAI